MLTADDFAQQIIAQIRILDPSFSGIVGTPERKIIDSVSQALADNQIDMTGLGSALDVDTKIGTNLDQFTSLFGFYRQAATNASGYVVYSRNTPAPSNITIPSGSLIQANNSGEGIYTSIQFETTGLGTIAQGQTASGPIPVQAIVSGTSANLPANSLNMMVGTPVSGVTSVTNPLAITNGSDAEDDNSYKARFKNTWARNLAGTASQYLALALAGTFTTKANVIGFQSRYQEYIQVPDFDDSGINGGNFSITDNTFGITGQWTTALSQIAYAKQIFTDTPTFIADDQTNPTYFFREGVDYQFNYPPYLTGDALREQAQAPLISTETHATETVTITTGGSGNVPVESTGGFPATGYFYDLTTGDYWFYESIGTGANGAQFETVTWLGNVVAGQTQSPISTNDAIFAIQLMPLVASGGSLYLSSVVGLPSSGTVLVGLGRWTGFASRPNIETNGPDPIYNSGAGSLMFIAQISYLGIDQNNSALLNCTWLNSADIPSELMADGWALILGGNAYLLPTSTNPNFTFLDIFNPVTDIDSGNLQIMEPGDVVLSEYSYVSTASRNDLDRNINNAIDVYVNGENDTSTSTIFLPNVTTYVDGVVSTEAVNNIPNSPWYYENFRRDGEPAKRPQLGNIITPLFSPPIDSVPDTIQINGQNFYMGWHYWLVHEVGDLGGTIRARDGIEWNLLPGDDLDERGNPLAPYNPDTSQEAQPGNIVVFSTPATAQPIEIDNYTYDANITALQASCEANKQITTDVLVHKAAQRYFKFDVTVAYAPGSSVGVVNSLIATTVQTYLSNQYFGAVIQLSSLLDAISSVPGVQNVRWSNDLPLPPNSVRVIETDINGIPLSGASIDRWTYGSSTVHEKQTLYIVGNPTGNVNNTPDSFTLTWTDPAAPTWNSGPIPFIDPDTGAPVTATYITESLAAGNEFADITSGIYYGITLTEDTRPTVGVTNPIRSFTVTYPTTGQPYLPSVSNIITNSDLTYDTDFMLLDDQLPTLPTGQIATDTLPGLIIRPRAQNTWLRAGLSPPSTAAPISEG